MRLILALMACLVLAGCDSAQNSAASPPQALSFNVTDKGVTTNGNIAVAIEKLANEKSDSVWQNAELVSVETLTKSPYSHMGKLRKIRGEVFKVEELPPDPDRPGHWSEILLLVDNSNSHVGATTVDFMYDGDISNIRSGQHLTCAGYFVGSYESQNAMGGTIEALAMVGNSWKVK